MGEIYYLECLHPNCLCGVQIGKHFGAIPGDYWNELYDAPKTTLIEGKHLNGFDPQDGAQGTEGALMDAIQGTDAIIYREVPKHLITKLIKLYKDKLEKEPQQTQATMGFWNDATTAQDFVKDVIGFLEEHKECNKICWQANGHLFGSRRLTVYHHKNS